MRKNKRTIVRIFALTLCVAFLLSGCFRDTKPPRKESIETEESNTKASEESDSPKESNVPTSNPDADSTGSNTGEDYNGDKESDNTGHPASNTEDNTSDITLSDIDFEISDKVICMITGEQWKVPVNLPDDISEDSSVSSVTLFTWDSSDPSIAEVDSSGNVYALEPGSTVIRCKNDFKEESICLNVYEDLGGGSYWDMNLLTSPDQTISYRNYAQGAMEYGEVSPYVAMHGCALCCTTTVIGALYPEENWTPQRVLSELEPEANEEGFQKNYAKSIQKQMPLSLKGISRVLDVKEIPHSYVTSFDKENTEELTHALAAELKQGHPIIYEAGNGGYHMMLLLGILTDGNLLVSDSVGEARVRIVSPEHVAEQMFSCKEEPMKSYFAGRKTAGGYIIVRP